MMTLMFPAIVHPTAFPKAPTSLSATMNSYGDMRFMWSTTGNAPPAFRVNVISPSTGLTVRSEVVTGQSFYDYIVDKSAADYGFVPTVAQFTIQPCTVSGSAVGPVSSQFQGTPTLDNSHVTNLIVFAGDSQSAAHFENLSGATPNLWSATTFRGLFAANNGLRPAQVVPLSAAWGSACADKDAQVSSDPNNWYWNLEGGTPGPRATQVISAIQATGLTPSHMLWALDTDVGSWDDTSFSPEPTPTSYMQAMQATFAYFRSTLGLPNLPIYISPTAGAYSGSPATPLSLYAYEQARAAEYYTCYSVANTYLAMVPPASSVSDFIPEPPPNQTQYAHYQPYVYQNIANAYATAIKNQTNLSKAGGTLDGSLYPCAPRSIAAFQEGNGNTHLSWVDAIGRTFTTATWTIQTLNLSSSAVISTYTSTTPTYLYTAAQGTADYGSPPTYIDFTVTCTTSLGTSQNNEYSNNVTSLPAPTGLACVQDSALDQVFTWTSVAGTNYVVTVYNVNDSSVRRTVNVTDGSGQYIYTAAQQTTDYGFTTKSYYFGVSSVQAGTGYLSAQATKSGTLANWYVKATALKAVYQANNDVIFSWTADNTKQWQMVNYNVSTNAILTTVNLPVGTLTYTFTAAAQTAAYGFTTHNIHYTVAQYDPVLGNAGATTAFNGTATSS